jgi:hypothetical protein
MARLLIFATIAAAVLTVFAVVDCALTERARTRALPKWAWLLIALLVPIVGPLLWLLIGRGTARTRPVTRVIGPDDDPDFLGTRGRPRPVVEPDDARWKELEQELANLDSDADDEGDSERR